MELTNNGIYMMSRINNERYLQELRAARQQVDEMRDLERTIETSEGKPVGTIGINIDVYA